MTDLSKRYRAARAYAGLKQVELAEKLGVDEQTVKRREGGQGDPKRAELIAVGAICGVPQEFMLHGFVDEALGREGVAVIGERLAAIESQLEALSREGVERDLEDAEQRRRDAETAARAKGGQDHLEGGAGG